MEFIKLESSGSKEFREAWKIYESSFPSDEKRTLELQKELIKNKQYNFFIVIKDRVLVAIITDWNFEYFLFVDHFAIKEEFRGKGIGTGLLREYLSKNKQKIVLEVERPETEIATKRIKFYEKIGFKLNTFDYIQPPYGKDKNPVPMLLMTYPEKINKSEFSSIREKLHITVYGLEKPLLGDRIN
ncbi:MAG TPA: GNAT family N-acetyltransferase [Candidatus Nanoarchaeia archaeon]|nr:GNAT family N-acetyltransferase [Candidatus Nanoarchaeia archaeon]